MNSRRLALCLHFYVKSPPCPRNHKGPRSARLFSVSLGENGNQNAYFITRLTPNALKSSVSIVYSTVFVPGPLFGS